MQSSSNSIMKYFCAVKFAPVVSVMVWKPMEIGLLVQFIVITLRKLAHAIYRNFLALKIENF